MEQKMRFGLISGRSTENKFGLTMSHFRGRFFHVFVGKKILKKKHCSLCTKKLHSIFFIYIFFLIFEGFFGKK